MITTTTPRDLLERAQASAKLCLSAAVNIRAICDCPATDGLLGEPDSQGHPAPGAFLEIVDRFSDKLDMGLTCSREVPADTYDAIIATNSHRTTPFKIGATSSASAHDLARELAAEIDYRVQKLFARCTKDNESQWRTYCDEFVADVKKADDMQGVHEIAAFREDIRAEICLEHERAVEKLHPVKPKPKHVVHTWQEARQRAEDKVRIAGWHGQRALAREIRCSEPLLRTAVAKSPYLKARKAEYEAKRKPAREVTMTDKALEDAAVLKQLVREQDQDRRGDLRLGK